MLAVAFSGCQEDECPTCIQGTCVDNACECDALHEGEDCSIPTTDKFIGDWQRGDICGSGSQAGLSVIETTIVPGRIRILSIGPEQQSVFADVKGDEIAIPQQTYATASIEGLGAIDEAKTTIILDYQLDYQSGISDNCFTTLSR